jgi:hypothetical protein
MEPDRPERDSSLPVIVQQYSPITFVSPRFHSNKKKFGARLKYHFHIFLLF